MGWNTDKIVDELCHDPAAMSEARSIASEDLAKEVLRRALLTSAEVTEEI